jgi:hypothetical protein
VSISEATIRRVRALESDTPLGGFSFDDAPHPVWERGWWNVPLELVGLALCWWIVQRADLSDPERRSQFWRTGRLSLPIT